MRHARPRRAAPVLIAAAALGAGGMAVAAVAATTTTTRVLANGTSELSYNRTVLTAPKGRVILRYRNTGFAEHDVALRGRGLARPKRGARVQRGGVSVVRAVLPRGVYTFYCSVPGHEAAGMKGRLTVR